MAVGELSTPYHPAPAYFDDVATLTLLLLGLLGS
jgi:hypothetical protein